MIHIVVMLCRNNVIVLISVNIVISKLMTFVSVFMTVDMRMFCCVSMHCVL